MPNSINSSSSEDGEWDVDWYPSPLRELTNLKKKEVKSERIGHDKSLITTSPNPIYR